MANADFIDDIVKNKHYKNSPGVFSICSANPYVLRASIRAAKKYDLSLLIESTCNQVNQYGGYMNLKPEEYVNYIEAIAEEMEFPLDRIFLGGDHLGPSVWKNEPAGSAMKKSVEMIRAYVRAGFQKIHLDASMSCQDDPNPLPKEIVAEREALLGRIAMEENRDLGREITRLTFVVGTEVPTPGGSMTDESEVQVSKVEETKENISITEEAFKRNHLEDVWQRVLAFVVQPGVEFSDSYVHPYNRDKARELSRFIKNYENLVYEAHSTDYQSRSNLKKMVADHFAILKVGPALTFALREALFSLEEIEREVTCKESIAPSNLKHVLDKTMISNPQSWIKYYSKDPEKQSFQRRYSLLDRSRYYLNTSSVDKSIKLLISNLSTTEIPLSLVSQYFPDQIDKIKEGKIKSDPHDLIYERIGDVINNYIFACSKGEPVLEAEGIH